MAIDKNLENCKLDDSALENVSGGKKANKKLTPTVYKTTNNPVKPTTLEYSGQTRTADNLRYDETKEPTSINDVFATKQLC